MKKIPHISFSLLVCNFLFLAISAQTPPLQWAKSMGGTGSDIGNSIATDALGNVYTTGSFQGTVDFDPDTGVFNLTSTGSEDIFISKIDAVGNFVWVKAMGGPSQDIGYSIFANAAGNIFTAGFFNGTADFDPGTGVFNLTSFGVQDIFISKLDASGNFVWAISTGGGSGDYARAVSTDSNGNIFVAGKFSSSTIIFGSTTLTNLNGGYSDMFLAKYDANGNVLWAKSAGGNSNDAAYSVSTDTKGNCYVAGYFWGASITFGTTTLTNAGTDDLFLTKYDTNGNVLWAKRAGGSSYDYATSLCTDTNGNILMAGHFQSPTMIFGTSTLTNLGGADIFLSKYDSLGDVLWAKSAGGSFHDVASSVSTDANGNILVVGNFISPSITFSSTTLTNAGAEDMFLAKYDTIGNVLWAISAGGSSGDYAQSVSSAANGAVFVIGGFSSSSLTFSSTTLTNAGAEDVFIAKWLPTNSISGTIYKSNNITQITSGKVYLINATLGIQLAYIDSFTLNGTNGNYSFSNVNFGNYLIVAKPDIISYPNAVRTYYGDTTFWQWAIILNLTNNATGMNIRVKEVPPLAGIGLLKGRIQYGIGSGKTGNGSVNPFGDPVPDIDIILEEIPGGIKAHTSTDNNGYYVFGSVPINATYKIMVDLATLIMDSTYMKTLSSDNTEFTNLDFVIDTTSGDTGVFVGWPLSTKELNILDFGFKIYPNPNDGIFTLELTNSQNQVSDIKIFNVLGELIYQITLKSKKQTVNFNAPVGIYNVQIENEECIFNRKIIAIF